MNQSSGNMKDGPSKKPGDQENYREHQHTCLRGFGVSQ